jgi:peptidase M28-like protein
LINGAYTPYLKGDFVRISIFAAIVLSGVMAVSHPLSRAQVKESNVSTAAAAHEPFGNVEAITAAQLKEWLYVVASDDMEGRDTPSRGLDQAAKFIADHLSQWKVKPGGDDGTYLQKFALTSRRVEPELTIASFNGQSFKLGEDFIAEPIQGQATGNLVFVGHGHVFKDKDIDAYQGIDVKGKIMLVVEKTPRGVSFQDFRGRKAGEDYDTPETYARAHGARGIIYIPSASTITFWRNRHEFSLHPSRMKMEKPRQIGANIPMIYASEKMVKTLLDGEKLDYETIRKQADDGAPSEAFNLSANKQVSFNVNAKIDRAITQNVVGVIEGADPVLKKEYVAVGAHYDHVGMSKNDEGDRIFNGADDDGSGTVATMAIAEALAKSPERPKRSVIFVWHAGEEKGLWGSEFFTSNPVVPIEQIVTQLNIDMIGRSKKEGDANPANKDLTGPNGLYVIGSKMMSTDLGNLSEEVNNSFLKLAFNYKYDDPNDGERFFYRSDHFNYAKRGVPIIFYFSGVHEDYHGLADTPDKIDYQKMEKVARTVFATMWKLANAPERPKVDKPLPPQTTN